MTDLSQQAEAALRMVREANVLSFDTETSGVDWRRNFPVGWVIGSTPTDVVYAPTRHGGGGNLPDPDCPIPTTAAGDYKQHRFEKELAKAFDDRNRVGKGPVVGHNLKFDAHFSANVGVMLGRNLSCTQNTQALLDEYTKSFSLDAVAREHGVTAKRGEELYRHLANLFGCVPDRKSMAHFWETSGQDPLVVEYATGDGVTTLELYLAQKAKIEAEELDRIWRVENELIWTLFRMERRGIKVDTEYLQHTLQTIEQRVEQAYEELPDGFNPRSPKQVQEYVEQFATDWPTTEKGNPSFTEKWLKTFPQGQNVVAVRKWTNLANSFAHPLLEEHTHNGRVHSTLNQNKADDHGTISGRLSCSFPNLQQVPKHDKELAQLFRAAFVADEGMEFYEADWSQAEPRLFAHYSNDKRLVDGYNADPPKDVHTIVAEMLNKDRATTAKRMNMGIFTGMFPKSFAGHMGCSVPEATEMWNSWHQLFPAIRPFQDKAKQVMMSRGFVRTIMGRKGRLENRRFAYKAVSKIIQGGQADMMKHKMVEIDKQLEAEGDRIHLLMQVHDSLIWQAPANEYGRKRSAELKDYMADVQSEPFNLRVPFVSDFGVGRNWAEASFGEQN